MDKSTQTVMGEGNAPRYSVLDLLRSLPVKDRRRYVGYSIINGKIQLILADE